jgi:hypothetical protein
MTYTKAPAQSTNIESGTTAAMTRLVRTLKRVRLNTVPHLSADRFLFGIVGGDLSPLPEFRWIDLDHGASRRRSFCDPFRKLCPSRSDA